MQIIEKENEANKNPFSDNKEIKNDLKDKMVNEDLKEEVKLHPDIVLIEKESVPTKENSNTNELESLEDTDEDNIEVIIEKLNECKNNYHKRMAKENKINNQLMEIEKRKRMEEEESIKLIKEMQKDEEEELKRRQEIDEESLKLIKAMEEEEKADQEERRRQGEEDNATNCEICLDKIDITDLLPLDRCGHLYHPKCLRRYFETEINARHFPLTCPTCKSEVSSLDMKDILPPNLLKKWDEYSFKKIIDSNPQDYSYCPTPDCPYVFVLDEGEDSNDFTCPQCAKHYCLNCHCEFHYGKSCAEYRVSNNFLVITYITIRKKIRNSLQLSEE